jgi:predicted DNA-binding antitoxin AbrB/MazE fold protein
MSQTVRAVFENGVFRPVQPVELPENSVVEFEPRPVEGRVPDRDLDAIYEVLSRRYDGGERDIAARHNEHQP